MTEADTLVGGRYRLLEQLAVGGMGIVWLARDERLHRTVAVKQLLPQPGLPPAEAELAGHRATREARITARLHHPNAVPVYDIVEQDGQPCLVMQYLPSTSLQRLLAEKGTLPVAQVARWGAQVAAALAAAHEAGIAHRDVKPGNLLIGEDGDARITDFGIAHALGDVTVTSTGMVTGTPAFLAPEAARGEDSGYPADVFSLGATLYAAVEGAPPFGAEQNPMALLHRVASGGAAPPRRAGALSGLLVRMLADDPRRRPAMRDVATELAVVASRAEGAAAPTQRIAPPTREFVAAAVVPGAPVVPPVRAASTGPVRRRLSPLALVALLLVAGIGVTLAVVLLGNSHSGNGSGSAAPQHPRVASSHASQAAQTSSPTGNSTGVAGNQPDSGQATGSPAKAIVDYYALLPGNTDAAWARLTAGFQNGRAGGRESFDAFWAQLNSVSAGDAQQTGNDTVEATVHYAYRDGRTSDERTRFHLVQQDGIWKIAATEVIG